MRYEAARLHERLRELRRHEAPVTEWRRLQYDAVCALVGAQRKQVALHSVMLAKLRAGRELYGQLRIESLELALECDGIRELIRQIERGLNQVDLY